MAAQAAGTRRFGGDYPAITPMLPTGSAAGTPHLTWSERPFLAGEATTIELAGAYRATTPRWPERSCSGPPPRLARDRRP